MTRINEMSRLQSRLKLILAKLVLSLLFLGTVPCRADLPDVFDRVFLANDSLSIEYEVVQVGSAVDSDRCADTNEMLTRFKWETGEFSVTCERPKGWRYESLVRFPSPQPVGSMINDSVAMEWHMARNEAGEISAGPAVIVVHESGREMTVGRSFAFLLSRAGIHAFMIQLPGYGERRDDSLTEKVVGLVERTTQGISDVRRARDAVACLPLIDNTCIALQGTSLGGFVAANSAGLDRGFDKVFIMLAGGDLYSVINEGDRDAARVRERLADQGLTGNNLKTMLYKVEPNRLAHRLDAEQTWLFSGRNDTVVPLRNAVTFAEHAGLDSDHHIILEADHYSGVVHLPTMVLRMRAEMSGSAQQ